MMLRVLVLAVFFIMVGLCNSVWAEYDSDDSEIIRGYFCANVAGSPDVPNTDLCVKEHYKIVRAVLANAWQDFVRQQSGKVCDKRCRIFKVSMEKFMHEVCKSGTEACVAAFDAQRVLDLQSLNGKTYGYGDSAYGKNLDEIMLGKTTNFEIKVKKPLTCKVSTLPAPHAWADIYPACQACDQSDQCLKVMQDSQNEIFQVLLNPSPLEFTMNGKLDQNALKVFIANRKKLIAALALYRENYCRLIIAKYPTEKDSAASCAIAVNNSFNSLFAPPF